MLDLSYDQVDICLHLSHFMLRNRQWDLYKLVALLPYHLVKLIKGIPLLVNPIPETPVWGLSSSAEFTVKSATWLADIAPFIQPKWAFSVDLEPTYPPRNYIFSSGKFVITVLASTKF